MAQTLLQLTNRVLTRLREDEVTSTTQGAYPKLIAEFVKQATHEVEMAWDWVQLRDTIQIATTATTFNYILTGAKEDYNILHVYEDQTDYELERAKSYEWMNEKLLQNTPDTGPPTHWDVNGTDGTDPVVNVWPIPDDLYSLNFNLVIRSHLSADGDSTPAPWLPIVLRATYLAIEERGDDQGTTLPVLLEQYETALANSIQLDASQYPDETTWYED